VKELEAAARACAGIPEHAHAILNMDTEEFEFKWTEFPECCGVLAGAPNELKVPLRDIDPEIVMEASRKLWALAVRLRRKRDAVNRPE